MIEFTEAQLVELILVAAKRGYKQAIKDAESKVARGRGEWADKGIAAYRKNALEVMRKRLSELKELKANDLLVTGFNEAIEYLEFGVDADWNKLHRQKESR